ncbi:hypothetical protein CDCA_CDCA09G2740 [Cyanidium caldarium]|uniref:Inositol 2-dehydrogenase n=1 Tax=Cyanidium caldarium TaxID=2771 RepID=A0AAV9IX99_CYACA|nr:hypothetical protein CDCA_CDCA09G2740 [Cyanidium caldarium]
MVYGVIGRALAAGRRGFSAGATIAAVQPVARRCTSVTVPSGLLRCWSSVSASSTVNVGIIGAGRIGQVHSETLSQLPNARCVHIADFVESAAKAAATKFNIPRVSTDYRKILEDKEVHAVFICSPSSLHTEQIKAAAAVGKHIFCEKPLAVTLAEADDVIATVEKAGVKMMLAFQRRFDPFFSAAQAAIARGDIGEPYTFKLTSRDPAPPPIDYLKMSGGQANDQAIHDFDVARFMMNGGECTEVFTAGACRIDPKIASEAGDTDVMLIMLKFDNGAFGTIEVSRACAFGYDQRVEVFGSKGQVSFGNAYPNDVLVEDSASVRRAAMPYSFFMDRYKSAYRNEVSAFVECILNNTAPPTTARDGKAAMVLARAAKRSLLEGRPVKTSEIRE